MHHGVIVGIDRYEESGLFQNLKYAQSDAQQFAKKLLDHPDTPFTADSLHVLTNEQQETALLPKRQQVFLALGRMCVAAKPSDLILFYFSGHGFEFGGSPYLVAQDTVESALADTGLSVDRVLARMNDSKAKTKVLLLDACRRSVTRAGVKATAPSEERPIARQFGGALQRAMEADKPAPG